MPVFTRSALFVSLLLLAAVPAAAQDTPTDTTAVEAAGVEAADAWLALVDREAYAESYDAASALLKEQVTAEQWEQTISSLASQLAALDSGAEGTFLMPSRDLLDAEYTTQLPNAPEGEYIVVQYRRVVGEQPLIELVFLTYEDEAWRVAGYFARPEEAGAGQ